ncbi:NACHT and WD repeat domain-containing protein [Rhodococcus sp. NPDC060090]|uniref:NACHT and WD repeat domain-containing protein n=1 Tax=Rhodococcus sp. NPDC060090 TaxID=3347056 RepID=UPI00364B9A83
MRADGGTAQSADHRRFFADQLLMLFAAAGRPALKKVVSGASAISRAVGNDRTVSVQRVSDWRSGKRVPASFESVHPVLVVLIRSARELTTEPPAPGLYSLKQWETWWKAARGETGGARSTDKPPAVVADTRPYKGLSAYRADDARMFFGRTKSMRMLADTVVAAHGQGPVIVTGASGVGKSSLVQAGLIPLMCGGGDCAPVVFTPGPDPVSRLVEVLPTLAGLEEPSGDEVADRTAVHEAIAAQAQKISVSTLLVVVDQFEDLFTQCDDPDRRTYFLALLEHMSTAGDTDAPAHVVATMRSDFYEQAVTYPALARALERRSKAVQPLDRDDLVEVISAPAKLLGVRLEAGLVDLILHDLGVLAPGDITGTELPLLSHLLDTMWDKRTGGALTVAGYRETGGVRGSIAAGAERAWESLDEGDREIARTMMVHLVYVTNTGTDVKMARPLSVLLAVGSEDRAAATRVVDHFVSARVLVAREGHVELIHDAVIVAWPRLKSWIQEDRQFAASRQQVEADAANWVESDRNRGMLYQRGRLDLLAEQGARFGGGDAGERSIAAVSPAALEFLRASRRQIEWQRRLRGSALAGLVLLTIVALVMGGLAWVGKNRADEERKAAQFQQVVALSDSTRSGDPTMSAHLALAATSLEGDSEVAYSRLLATQGVPLARVLVGHTGPVYGTAISPDGSTLASASDDGTVRLWSLSGDISSIGDPLVSSSNYMASVSFSPDGRYLAAGGGDGGVWIWDMSDRASPRPVLNHRVLGSGAVHNVRYSPDGQMLAVPYDDGSLVLLDTSSSETGRFPDTRIQGHEGGVRTVSFRTDGSVLATASDDRTVRLWDVSDIARPSALGDPLTGFGDVAHSVSFNADGTVLAASSDDGVLWLFDTTDPRAPQQLGTPVRAHTGGVWTISFLADGHTLVSASWDGTVKLWSVDTESRRIDELTPALTGHGGGVPALAVTPTGDTIITGGQDANLRIWTMPHRRVFVSPAALTLPVTDGTGNLVATGSYDAVVRLWHVGEDGWSRVGQVELTRPLGGGYVSALSPSGTILAAAATSGGSVELWDVANPASPRRLGEPLALTTRFTSALTFGPKGTTLVTGDDDYSVQLWDLSDPAAPRPWGPPLVGPTNLVRHAEISPDGRSLVLTSADGRIYAWDITDRSAPRSVPVTQGHSAGVNGVSFAPDSSVLVTGGDDHQVVVWDRDEAGGFTARATKLRGHTGTVYSVSVSPDGSRVVSGSDDGTVRLWDVSDPDAMRAVGGPITDTGVGRWQAMFHPNGTVIAAGGDGVLRTWSLDAEAVVERICSSTSGQLRELLPQFGLPLPRDEAC